MGQVYVRPVGVLTDGRCEFACEVLAANFQDNKIGPIFGEDPETGGVGSDIAYYSSYFNLQRPDHFPAVPLNDQISNLAQDFSIGWRQLVRIDGSLIEDVGVKSDMIVRPTVSELLEFSSDSQYDRIADALSHFGNKTGQNDRHFRLEPLDQVKVLVGTPVFLKINTKGYSSVSVVDELGHEIRKLDLDPNVRRTRFIKFRLKNPQSIERFNILGTDSNGKVIFSAWRSFQFVHAKPLTNSPEIRNNE